MFRPLPVALVLTGVAILLLAGFAASPAADPADGNLILNLPTSAPPPPWAPDRLSKLTVDGKDFSTPRGEKRVLTVAPAKGKGAVKVVFDYWPNSYTNVIRTKEVKLAREGQTAVDFTKEDPNNPDKVRPIYFPTPRAVVEAMCKMAQVGKEDVVYDIGCGDGRLVIAGVKQFGARRGVGIDIDPGLINLCKKNAAKAGVADRVEFKEADALKIKDYSEASVVLLYLGEIMNLKVRPALRKTLKPGSRVVSHRFLMGDWKPDVTKKIIAKNNYDMDEEYVLHLWTIK